MHPLSLLQQSLLVHVALPLPLLGIIVDVGKAAALAPYQADAFHDLHIVRDPFEWKCGSFSEILHSLS